MPAQNGRLKLRIIRGSNKGEQSVCAILQAFRAAALVGPKHFFSKFPAFQFPCTFTSWVFAAPLWAGWRRLRAAGHHVTGCDADVYPPMSTQLQAQGIELLSGHDPAQLSVKADLYIVGNAITRGNALMEAI